MQLVGKKIESMYLPDIFGLLSALIIFRRMASGQQNLPTDVEKGLPIDVRILPTRGLTQTNLSPAVPDGEIHTESLGQCLNTGLVWAVRAPHDAENRDLVEE